MMQASCQNWKSQYAGWFGVLIQKCKWHCVQFAHILASQDITKKQSLLLGLVQKILLSE